MRSMSALGPSAQPTRRPGKLTFEKLRSSTVPPLIVQLLDGRQRFAFDSATRRRRRSRLPGRRPRAAACRSARRDGQRQGQPGGVLKVGGHHQEPRPSRAPARARAAANRCHRAAPECRPAARPCRPADFSSRGRQGLRPPPRRRAATARGAIRSSACWQPLVTIKSSPGAGQALGARACSSRYAAAVRSRWATRAAGYRPDRGGPSRLRNWRGNRPAETGRAKAATLRNSRFRGPVRRLETPAAHCRDSSRAAQSTPAGAGRWPVTKLPRPTWPLIRPSVSSRS